MVTVESEKQGHRRGRGKRRRLGVSRGKGDYWVAAIEDIQVGIDYLDLCRPHYTLGVLQMVCYQPACVPFACP